MSNPATLAAPRVAQPATAPKSAPAAAPGAAAALRSGLALHLQAVLLSHAQGAQAAAALAGEMASTLGCSRVSLGFVHRGHVRLYAVSHGADEGLCGPAFDPLAAAMDEAIDQGISVCLPTHGLAPSAIRLAHTQLQQRQGGAVATVPMVWLGDTLGALTCEWASAPADLQPLVRELEHIVGLLGPVAHLMQQRDAPWHERCLRAWRDSVRALAAPQRRGLRMVLGGFAFLLAALTLVPVDHRVGGRARVEGTVQHSVVAPVDGFLKSASVRPGDTVTAGQLLVELADEDLLLQRRRWLSEQGQHESAYATALARADRSGMVIALSRAEEAQARIGLIDAELARSRITAPYDGIVVQGDLSQSLGAPVERGKVLLLLAPGGEHRVVVEIDERDIAAVAVGQQGSVSLSALPWDALPITVSRVNPLARAVDGRNVFEVEASVRAEPGRIRPGLEGAGKIVVGGQPLGRGWFERLGGWLRLSLWAWWP